MINNNTNQHLVSIIVVTYNSSEYILETLESTKNQTYQHIELIVADDSSIDNTVEICKKWIEKNNKRFVSSKIVASEKNKGIPANCNNGLYVSRGKWIKLIAGDDVLKENCIETYINFIHKNIKSDIKSVFALQQRFNDVLEVENFTDIIPTIDNHVLYSRDSNAKQQFQSLLKLEKYIPGPASFFDRQLLIDLNGFIEKYKMLEDYPLYLRILEKGYKIHFLPEITVYYRIHSKSVLRKDINKKIITDLNISWNHFQRDYVIHRVSFIRKIDIIWQTLLIFLVIKLGNKGRLAKSVFKIGKKLRPVRILSIKKKLIKNNH